MTASPERPARPRPTARRAVVVATQRVSASMVRLVLGGDGLRGLVPSPHTDSYVKLVFVPPGTPRPLPGTLPGTGPLEEGLVDLATLRAALPADAQPRQRSYTVRAADVTGTAGPTITIDVVVHGDRGVAGPWAAGARVGDEILVVGPGGGYSPDLAADGHLLVGDASALPAIAVTLERLAEHAPEARGDAIIEVHDAADEVPLVAPTGVGVRWVHQGAGVPGVHLVEAVRALRWAPGHVDAFVHGEAGWVATLRHHLRVERGLPRAHLSVSGYWRLGADDEGWRAAKRDWTAALDAAEAGLG